MGGLISAPIEIITRIYQNCDDFADVISLATTCKHLNSVWITNSSPIIWRIAKSQIRCFDDALMAVRATAIVLQAYRSGSLPPSISMQKLSGKFQKPNLEELKEVLNMQHLVRCIEFMFLHSSINNSNLFGYSMMDFRQEPGRGQEESWKDRFYRAMYRLLLAGAALARAYTEPLFQAKQEGRADFVVEFLNEFDRARNRGDWNDNVSLKDEDVTFLRQFPVYNFDVTNDSEIGKWRNSKYEEYLGPFASWLVEDGRAREGADNPPLDLSGSGDSSSQDKGDKGAVQELMLLLVAYEHLDCKFTNGDKKAGFGRFPWEMGRGRYVQRADHSIKGDIRKVSVVLFGVFHVEEISMPVRFEDTKTILLSANPHPGLVGTEGENISKQLDVGTVLWGLGRKSRSTYVDTGEYPEPPALFELWHFALRHYLNLGFRSRCFWMWRECMWWEDVGSGEVFERPDWAIVQPYEPGKVSWHA